MTSIITDRQGLHDLPIGSKIVCRNIVGLTKTGNNEWHDENDGMDHDTREVMGDYAEGESWLPAMVVETPKAGRKFRISRVTTIEKGWSKVFPEDEMRMEFPDAEWDDERASHAGHIEDAIDNYQPCWLEALADDDYDANVTSEVWKVEEL